jgi:murein DD-endopeptidase MepM/ murein hydrolase activator NlpD
VPLPADGDLIAAQPFEDGAPKIADDEPAPEPAPSGPKPSIYASLYQTGIDNGLPMRVIEEIARAFSFDVDFNASVRPGDGFRVVYAMPDPDEPDAAAPTEILYASLTAGGVERRLYRYKTPDDGTVDYYDESGRSAQKFLLRKPMARGVFRSGFGMRRHPILKYRKMHSGVDWAAPRGTPIYAAGSGTVVKAGWHSGYGRLVSVQHKYGYKSRYAHMSRIADGVTVGTKVKQGQVVGYVGTTGLSTGPHLHYELLVNDRAVNPLKIRLPRGRELAGETRDAFLKDRARIDALLQQDAPAQVARR